MNCRRVSSLISAYIDGELTGLEMLEMRRHFDGCRSCKLQYESLRYTKQILSRLSYAEPRAGLAEQICARLDSVKAPGYQKLWNRMLTYGRARLTPVAVGCAALGTVLAVLVSYPTTKEPEVVALPRPAMYASALPLPPATTAPLSTISVRPEEPQQPLIPEPAPTETSGSGMFSFANFEGH